jgi:hypothetical protein
MPDMWTFVAWCLVMQTDVPFTVLHFLVELLCYAEQRNTFCFHFVLYDIHGVNCCNVSNILAFINCRGSSRYV